MGSEIKDAMKGVCVRVLEGNCTLQETATLPAILKLLLENENAALENGETTINAVRQQYGLDPIKDGDVSLRLKKLD